MRVQEHIKHALDSLGVYRPVLRMHPFAGVAVLVYHGIRADDWPAGTMRHELLHVRARRLDDHCRALRDLCTPISLAEWRAVAAGQAPAPERPALVTFDDGYRSVLRHALPLLDRHHIPAAVFVCTNPIERQERFWFDTVAELFGEESAEDAKRLEYGAWRALVEQAAMPAAIDDPHAPLTIAELQSLASHPLIDVGAHTVSHPILARAPMDVQRAEIAKSRATLETWLARPVHAFAYPNGRRGVDYSADSIQAVADAGFADAFGVNEAFADPCARRLDSPRFLMHDAITGAELAHRLAVSWPRREAHKH
ncbi:MAG TPA: polysaccharide deacetylase family protein [Vicinamibacterales bacterium]|nr:polysaccharide deacetylase family protein [Vicinamibacterales bacterium]